MVSRYFKYIDSGDTLKIAEIFPSDALAEKAELRRSFDFHPPPLHTSRIFLSFDLCARVQVFGERKKIYVKFWRSGRINVTFLLLPRSPASFRKIKLGLFYDPILLPSAIKFLLNSYRASEHADNGPIIFTQPRFINPEERARRFIFGQKAAFE